MSATGPGVPAQRTYELWVKLIEDEALAAAALSGEPERVAAERGLSADDVEVLRAFARQRGTRWNLENLRFRTAQETSDTLISYLPRTMRMLTQGIEGWLQDLSYEYLTLHRWRQLGHLRFAECERFAAYARERIARRRPLPRHFDAVLDFELAVVRLLKKTAAIPASRWPAPPGAISDEALARLSPRRSEAMELIDLPVDLSEWIRTADPLQGQVAERPITVLAVVPSLREVHRVQVISEGARELLSRFDGSKPVADLRAELAEELDGAQVLAAVRRWLESRVLWA